MRLYQETNNTIKLLPTNDIQQDMNALKMNFSFCFSCCDLLYKRFDYQLTDQLSSFTNQYYEALPKMELQVVNISNLLHYLKILSDLPHISIMNYLDQSVFLKNHLLFL